MNTDPADRAFALYRKTGDVAALGALFDLVAPELLRVSAHLTRDVHAAEDLVQETFVAAIEAKPRPRSRPKSSPSAK